jgi:hypothetical protein
MNLTSLNEITYSSVTSLVAFVHDYQSLIAGLIAIAAAAITTRPVWLQLGRMSIQTNTMLREFLTDRLRNLTQARSWLHDNLDSFKEEVSRRIYEMREIEGKLMFIGLLNRPRLRARFYLNSSTGRRNDVIRRRFRPD